MGVARLESECYVIRKNDRVRGKAESGKDPSTQPTCQGYSVGRRSVWPSTYYG